jgi:hypothetical protein
LGYQARCSAIAFTAYLVYDKRSGQLLLRLARDSELPRANEIALLEIGENKVSKKTNPLVVEGLGSGRLCQYGEEALRDMLAKPTFENCGAGALGAIAVSLGEFQ